MPGVAAILEAGAVFEGSEQRPFDAIIFATGYRPNFQNFLHLDNSVSDLSRGVDPPLYFVGFKNPVTGLLWEISKEAQAVARDIAHRLL